MNNQSSRSGPTNDPDRPPDAREGGRPSSHAQARPSSQASRDEVTIWLLGEVEHGFLADLRSTDRRGHDEEGQA